VLSLQEVRVTLGDFELKDISLHVRDGQYMVLLGPTGTGKTVLLETIAGIHRVERGNIFISGSDITHMPPEKRNLGIVYQDYALFPHLTVRKNIAFGLQLRQKGKGKISQAVEEMAGFLGLRTLLDRHPGTLSGGERQRVALARALVLEPYILLLDEPLSALDRFARDRLRRELKRIHREIGVTIVHVTHDLTEAFFLADHLAVMKDGTILQQDTPENLLKRPADRAVAELIGIENLIPTTMVSNDRLHTRLGPMELSISPSDIMKGENKLYLGIPGWCIEVRPRAHEGRYAWKGSMKVVGVNFMDGLVELELAHRSGQHLRTRLSIREFGDSGVSFDVGAEVLVGILKEGLCCVPG